MPKRTEVDLDWTRLIDAERLVDKLVPMYHQHLETARIAVVGRPVATKRNGKSVLGKLSKVSDLELFALQVQRELPLGTPSS